MVKDTLSRVVDCIATTTRYPHSLLVPTADLENDLGIDSVKRLEIIVAIEKEFALDLQNQERDPSIRTIGNISNWVEGLIAVAARKPTPEPSALDRRTTAAKPHRQNHVVHQPAPRLSSPPHFSTATPASINPVGAGTETFGQRPFGSELDSISKAKPLAGRVALVTGSGRGVGKMIARVLAARGASVVVNSFHSRELGEQTVAEINSQGGSAIHLWGSVANPAHVNQMFAEIENEFGRLDILVCNASDGRIGSFMELDHEDWDRAFRTNVTGHHHCAVKASRLMRNSGGGTIITMSAVGAKGYVDGLGSQGVVKAAVETMTRYLACELGPYGIRVNCVAGGPVYGDLISKFPNAQAMQDHWESMTPDGELCSPLDLANTIAFLVSDDARGINGSVWMVDHGFSAIADGRPMRVAGQQSVFS